jgi:hypothetical protein
MDLSVNLLDLARVGESRAAYGLSGGLLDSPDDLLRGTFDAILIHVDLRTFVMTDSAPHPFPTR